MKILIAALAMALGVVLVHHFYGLYKLGQLDAAIATMHELVAAGFSIGIGFAGSPWWPSGNMLRVGAGLTKLPPMNLPIPLTSAIIMVCLTPPGRIRKGNQVPC
jgi:hypothetical protein